MKKFQIAGLTALTLFGSLASVQAQATTAPVGYVTLASVANPIPANTDVRLSVPMEASVDFTGLATSAAGNVITVTGASFTVNQFAPATGGYYVRIKNGASAGQTAEITANTADTLTVNLESDDDLTNIGSTTQIEIVKYFTLSTFFPNTLPVGTQVLFFNNSQDSINNAPTEIIVWTGASWLQSGVGVVDATLYPGENFILRNNSGSTITDIVITGNVPTIAHRVKLTSISSNQQDFAVSYLSPVSESIGNSGLGFSVGDQLLSYDRSVGKNKAPSKILVYTGSFWLESGVGNVNNTFMLNPGEGYTYRRAANNQGTTTWQDTQTYNQ